MDLALLVLQYYRTHAGLKLDGLYKYELGLDKQKFDATSSGKTRIHYEPLLASLYRFLTSGTSTGQHRLDATHEWMQGLVCDVFPELRGYFDRYEIQFDARLAEVSTQGENSLRKIVKCFGGKRHIYRYARNADGGEVRLAKGVMQVPEEVSGEPFHGFVIEYRPSDINGEATINRIVGNILLIKAFYVFFGVEEATDYPFVMIARDKGPQSVNGALILRKHHERGYMATKGLVSDLDAHDEVLGRRFLEDVPEITPELLDLIKNIGNHDGSGPLMLPDV